MRPPYPPRARAWRTRTSVAARNKQHDAVVGTDSPVECGRIANEGVAKRGLGFINRHRRHLLQIFDANQHIGWKETAPRRDDECPAESTRIRELPAEVETAHEGEN